eukprot:1790556-Rhodomonas_salina.3
MAVLDAVLCADETLSRALSRRILSSSLCILPSRLLAPPPPPPPPQDIIDCVDRNPLLMCGSVAGAVVPGHAPERRGAQRGPRQQVVDHPTDARRRSPGSGLTGTALISSPSRPCVLGAWSESDKTLHAVVPFCAN